MRYTTKYVETVIETNKKLQAVISALKHLHKPKQFADVTVCGHCWTISEQNITIGTNGVHYQYFYPCPTMQALEES